MLTGAIEIHRRNLVPSAPTEEAGKGSFHRRAVIGLVAIGVSVSFARNPGCDGRGPRHYVPTENQVNRAGDDDPDQPAKVRPTEEPKGDRSLQRGNEAVLHRPGGDQARNNPDHATPVD